MASKCPIPYGVIYAIVSELISQSGGSGGGDAGVISVVDATINTQGNGIVFTLSNGTVKTVLLTQIESDITLVSDNLKTLTDSVNETLSVLAMETESNYTAITNIIKGDFLKVDNLTQPVKINLTKQETGVTIDDSEINKAFTDFGLQVDRAFEQLSGVPFKLTEQNGWSIHTSLTIGLKIATLELDKDAIFSTNTPWIGANRTLEEFQEPLPVGVFTKVASVSVVPYCYNNNDYVCNAWGRLPFSNDYTGTFTTIAVRASNSAEATLPTTIHYVVTVLGF